jgi:hypothetical protein
MPTDARVRVDNARVTMSAVVRVGAMPPNGYAVLAEGARVFE